MGYNLEKYLYNCAVIALGEKSTTVKILFDQVIVLSVQKPLITCGYLN